MARRKIKAGSVSQVLPVFIQDTSSTTGAGLGSLVYNTAGLAAKYRRQGDSSWTAISLVTATAGTFTSGGFVADGGSVTGGYELGMPNAMLASGATWAQLQIYGAANMLPVLVEFELDAVDYQDTVRFGLTAIPNVASGSAGAIVTSGTGTAQISTSSGQVLVQSGTGTGQISLSSGAVIVQSGTGTGQISLSAGKVLLQATQTGVTIPTVTSVGGIGTGGITSTSFAAGAIDAAAIATDAIGSNEISAAAVTKIQTGLMLASSYTAPLDATGVRNAVGLASANLDTQLDALPTAAENAAALLDLANAIETGLTVRQAMRLIVAAEAGKVSGADGTTVTIRDLADTKDRIVATVDASGNRTALTRDLT